MRKLMVMIGVAAMSSLSFAEAPKLEVGMVAPDFAAKDQNGKEHALKDFAGKSAVALCFYPKALTGG